MLCWKQQNRRSKCNLWKCLSVNKNPSSKFLMQFFTSNEHPCFREDFRHCSSGLVNCSLNCSAGTVMAERTCGVFDFLKSLGLKPPCSEYDIKIGNWVRVFWGSSEDCPDSVTPVLWPGILNELMCCKSDGCNLPNMRPPSVQCLATASALSSGYCAGRTLVYRVCSAQEDIADVSGTVTSARAHAHTRLFNPAQLRRFILDDY